VEGDALVVRGFGEDERYPIEELPLVGRHNHENAMAAFLLARWMGVPAGEVRSAARTFRPLAHRMEWVGEGRGLVFYNDSKGTNVASVVKSLAGFPRPFVLLAGGRDKGGDLRPLREVVERHARAVVLLGEARQRFAAALAGAAPLAEARSMEEAVAQAVALSKPGDAIVLSPGCASFDMFRSFEHRGEAFRDAVRPWLDHGG
jgi:UDP-N-acetylmuramoylalanine--D-glutamate ligase